MKQFIHTAPLVFPANEKIVSILEQMVNCHQGYVVIKDSNGIIINIASLHELFKAYHAKPQATAQVMGVSPIQCIRLTHLISDLKSAVRQFDYGCYPVTLDQSSNSANNLVGLLEVKSLARHLITCCSIRRLENLFQNQGNDLANRG